tara:strand:- start:807 stop:1637 length:831 start_codon:yes stop_codon:yes gene_type:complete
MINNKNKLKKLRRQIDEVDSRIISLIRERIDIVQNIAKEKESESSIIRPGREANVLRNVTKDLSGELQVGTVVRIWRELISSSCKIQRDFTVAVCAPEKSVGYWDLARGHFGSSVSMSLHRSSKLVLDMVSQSSDVIGVMPMPKHEEQDPWWVYLCSANNNYPVVVGRLPFISKKGFFEDLEAVIIASFPSEKSVNDRTWILSETSTRVSYDWVNQKIENSGLEGKMLCSSLLEDEIFSFIIEVEGFYSENHSKVKELHEVLENPIRTSVIGNFPI